MNLKADNRRHTTTLGLLAACALIIALSAPSRGASGQGQEETDSAAAYSLWWHTIDGGGASFVSAGDYRLGGTAGQPDAGGQVSAGPYTLEGGFWVAAQGIYHVFLPTLTRGAP